MQTEVESTKIKKEFRKTKNITCKYRPPNIFTKASQFNTLQHHIPGSLERWIVRVWRSDGGRLCSL